MIERYPGSNWNKVSVWSSIATVWWILAAFLSIAIVATWQGYIWLRYGVWLPLTIADGLAYLDIRNPNVEWLGVQKVFDFVLAQALSIGAFVVLLAGSLVSFAIKAFADDEERARRELWRIKHRSPS